MPSRTRSLAGLPLLVVLFSAPAGAAPLGDAPFLTRLWHLVSAVWAEAGCGLDPSGHCGEGPVNLTAGCNIDPNGHCSDGPENFTAGCGIDPDGKCRE